MPYTNEQHGDDHWCEGAAAGILHCPVLCVAAVLLQVCGVCLRGLIDMSVHAIGRRTDSVLAGQRSLEPRIPPYVLFALLLRTACLYAWLLTAWQVDMLLGTHFLRLAGNQLAAGVSSESKGAS